MRRGRAARDPKLGDAGDRVRAGDRRGPVGAGDRADHGVGLAAYARGGRVGDRCQRCRRRWRCKSGDRTLGTTALDLRLPASAAVPGTGSATFTAELPDGTYPLTAQATDAAAQTATAAYGTLMLDRTAPASPTGLTVRAVGNGMYALHVDEPGPGASGSDRRRAAVGRHRREGREHPAARVGVARRARPSRGRGRERRSGDGGRRVDRHATPAQAADPAVDARAEDQGQQREASGHAAGGQGHGDRTPARPGSP